MQFESVSVTNFMSYERAEFTGFGDPGLTLIEGRNMDEGDSNGSGKSTMWDAISWALFGETVRGLKGDEVINRKAKKNCSVAICVHHEGKKYLVVRGRKDKTLGDRLVPFVDDESKEQGTVAMTQEWLLRTLGIDFELFRCTILFAQGETFNFVDSTNKQQKEILSKVMRLDFDEHLAKAKNKVKECESTMSDLERKLAVLESHVEDPTERYESDIREWDEAYEFRKRRLAADMKRSRAQLADIKGKLKAMDKLQEALDKIKDEESTTKHSLRDLTEKAGKVSAMESHWKKRLEGMHDGEGDCPTCFQTIDGSLIRSEQEQTLKKITDLRTVREKILSQVKTCDAVLIGLRSKSDTLREAMAEQRGLAESYKEVGRCIERLEADMEQTDDEVNPFRARLREELEKQKQIVKKMKLLSAELEGLKDRVPYLQFWVTAFGDNGIKSFVFDIVCSTLTNRANAHLNVLTNGAVTISFDTQKKLKSGELREKFDVTIQMNGESVDYKAYSGGEKRRIALAVDLALSELMADHYRAGFNVVVFDEQTSYMDKSGRQSFMKLLQEMARKKRVFVVDHDAEFKAMFDDSWTIIKENGVSRVVNHS